MEMIWLLPALLVLSVMLMFILRRYKPDWSTRRTLFIAAAALPGLAWLTLFVVEVTLIVHHHMYEPDEPFMAGAFIMLLPVALHLIAISMLANTVALAVTGGFRRPD